MAPLLHRAAINRMKIYMVSLFHRATINNKQLTIIKCIVKCVYSFMLCINFYILMMYFNYLLFKLSLSTYLVCFVIVNVICLMILLFSNELGVHSSYAQCTLQLFCEQRFTMMRNSRGNVQMLSLQNTPRTTVQLS